MTSQFVNMTLSLNFFFTFPCFKVSCWSKFHVNIITGFGDNFIYKGLTKNSEIENNPVWISANIWRLEQAKDTKFGKNVSDKRLTAKCQRYRENQQGVKLPPPPLGLNHPD